MSVVTLTSGFPRSDFRRYFSKDVESSGTGPDEPVRGSVRIVKLNPHFLRRAAASHAPFRNSPSRSAFPAFLALGRPGPSLLRQGKSVNSNVGITDPDARRKHGIEMWQKAMQKSARSKEAVALRANPKEMSKQSCAAVPFSQHITEDGCEMVTVQNKLCFGQCSSMFVPSSRDLHDGHQKVSCTRCGPSRSRTFLVHLRCGTETREKSVMLVEECKCETSSEDTRVQNTEMLHL
ncbi:hypothetical protein DNTS_004448 [Danionella cerebrum]|uniref:CTCK domain-containing protein n=1 Tax=Danionella cerebrum TaxID=2873325 RepID=A0A553PZC0_9TELE|nr:hypothetical protein DNTS_004448 [Danionella translucida]